MNEQMTAMAERMDPVQAAAGEPLLRVEDLRTYFFTRLGAVKAVDGM